MMTPTSTPTQASAPPHICAYMHIHTKVNKFYKDSDSDILKQYNSLKDNKHELMIPKRTVEN